MFALAIVVGVPVVKAVMVHIVVVQQWRFIRRQVEPVWRGDGRIGGSCVVEVFLW